MAAALSTLSERLCNDFFKPCYPPQSSEAGETMKEIQGKQYVASRQKERIARALLLSAYSPKEVDEAITKAVHETSDEVCELLSLIGGGEDLFRKEIKALFYEAANLWKEAQYSTKMVEASTTDDWEDWHWNDLEEFGSRVSETKAGSVLSKFESLNLFPCVVVPEIDHTVNQGCMLWADQNTVIAAEQEYAQCQVKRPNKARKPSYGGTRRFSSDATSGAKSDERPTFLDTKQKAAQTEGSQPQSGKSGG